jgi:hypothetical protein
MTTWGGRTYNLEETAVSVTQRTLLAEDLVR